MIELAYHIPTDEEAGHKREKFERRVLFMCTCAICKRDYEIRDGNWITTVTKKGREIKLMVCSSCYAEEES